MNRKNSGITILICFLPFLIFSCGGGGKKDKDAETRQETTQEADIAELTGQETEAEHMAERQEGEISDATSLSEEMQEFILESSDEPFETDLQEVDGEGGSYRLLLKFSRPVIELNIEGGSVDVSCLYLDPSDSILELPPDIEITTTAPDASVAGHTYSFEEIGEKEFICSSHSLGLETQGSVVVAFEGMDRGFIRMVEFVSMAQETLNFIVEAIDADDEAAYNAKVEELENSLEIIREEYFEGYSFLVEHPLGYPTRSEMEAAGFTTSSDDALYQSKLESISSSLELFLEQWNNLNPHSLDEAIIDEINRISLSIERDVDELQRLNPSEIFIMEANETFTPIMGTKLPSLMRISTEKIVEAFQFYGGSGGGGAVTKMTLPAMLVGLAINMIVDQLPSYKKLLKGAAKAATASAMMLALADLLQRYYTIEPDAPVYDSVHGSAAGFLVPGQAWIAVGNNFNPDLYKNVAIFLPPIVSTTFVDAIDTIIGDCDGIISGTNILIKVKQIADMIKTIAVTADYYGYSPLTILLVPRAVDAYGEPEMLEFGPLPTGVNPSIFPVVGILIPVNADVGAGPTTTVNVLSG